jgi:hypothetical protein
MKMVFILDLSSELRIEYFHSGVEQVVRFLEDDDFVVIIGDENGDGSVSVSTYSQKRMPIQIQAKPATRLLLRNAVTEESKLKTFLSFA